MTFIDIAEVPGAAHQLVYEHGWQSWSPSGTHPATSTSPRPPSPARQVMGYRPDKELPQHGFQGEGLLAVASADAGPVRIWSAPEPAREVASIRARVEDGRVVVSADGPVTEMLVEAASIEAALARWADSVAVAHSLPLVASIPPVWCSWYQYFGSVTADDIGENLASAASLGLPVGVVQVDDGHQVEVGDWLVTSGRFGRPVAAVAGEVRAAGRRPGIWTAPLLAAERSLLHAEHPDWMVGEANPGASAFTSSMSPIPTRPSGW